MAGALGWGCAPRAGRPAGPVVRGPQAQYRYATWIQSLQFPRRFRAQGLFEAQTRRQGEITGRITLAVTDSGAAVLATGPFGIPLLDLQSTWAEAEALVPETTALGILVRWLRDPLRYPVDRMLQGIAGPLWILTTPAGSLQVSFIDTLTAHLYISQQRQRVHQLTLSQMRRIHGVRWPCLWKYQGPEGSVDITWTQVTIPE